MRSHFTLLFLLFLSLLVIILCKNKSSLAKYQEYLPTYDSHSDLFVKIRETNLFVTYISYFFSVLFSYFLFNTFTFFFHVKRTDGRTVLVEQIVHVNRGMSIFTTIKILSIPENETLGK